MPAAARVRSLVLASLADSGRTARELRATLAEHGVRQSLPAFFEMMAGLEDDGLVTGRDELRDRGGQTFQERAYEITAAGQDAWRSFGDFLRARLGPGLA